MCNRTDTSAFGRFSLCLFDFGKSETENRFDLCSHCVKFWSEYVHGFPPAIVGLWKGDFLHFSYYIPVMFKCPKNNLPTMHVFLGQSDLCRKNPNFITE